MKRIFKFIPAALAVVALSSCSNDDLFGSAEGNLSQKNTLKVTVQQINDGDITRAANLGDGNGMVWQDGDQITVYDDMLFIYDPYKYNATAKAFVLDEDEIEMIDEPAYALFPTAYFKQDESTNWERSTDRVWVKATIDKKLKYGAPSTGADKTMTGNTYDPYVTSDGKTAYVSLLPMWGTASKNGETTEATMQYMTAIIKVTLTNAQDNVKYLYVRGFKDIAGTQPAQLSGNFKAYLSETGRTPLASTTLAGIDDASPSNNYIEVDISNINKATSIIYVPVPVGHYGKLQVWATKDPVTNPGTETINAADKIYDFVDKDFVVKFYGALTKKQYNVEVSSVTAINNLLQANKDEAKDNLVFDGSNGSATAATTTYNTIALPQMAAGTVELKLKDITGNPVTISGSDFSKKFILNLTSTAQAITINLPNADVVLAGNYNSQNVTIENARSLTFGDGTAPASGTDPTTKGFATIDIKAEVQGNVVVDQYAEVGDLTLPENHRANGITVNENGVAGKISVESSSSEFATATNITVAGTSGAIDATAVDNAATNVTVSGKSGYIFAKGSKNTGNIVVSGVCTSEVKTWGTGTITVSGVAKLVTATNANAGMVEISGAPNYKTGAELGITSGGEVVNYAKVGTVNTKGNVIINLSNEGAAIGTSLTMVANKTLTLTQGYVKKIIGPSTGDDKVTVALGDDANYKNVIIDETGNKVTVTGTTKWNGQAIGGTIDTEAKANAIQSGLSATRAAIISAWQAYADAANAIYTATGFNHQMHVASPGAITLANDIDLNGKQWTPATSGDAFTGAGKTIYNLMIEDYITAKANKEKGLGLFASLGHNVTNVIIDGVKISQATANDEAISNVGALAGKTSAAVTLTAVTVKNVSIDVEGKDATEHGAKAIGGIIGLAGGEVTMTGVQLAGESNTIKGYSAMGGLIGDAAGQVVTIQKKAASTAPTTTADVKSSVSNLSFIANYNSATTEPAIDLNYLKVGNFIGTATGAAQITITDADNIEASKLNRNTDAFVGGFMKFVDGVNFRDIVFGQGLIGYCCESELTKGPKINTKDYNVQTTKAAFDALSGNNKSLYYINK